MKLLQKLLEKLNPCESAPDPHVHGLNEINGDHIRIATTEAFNEAQAAQGDYLDEEVEEAVVQILPRRASTGAAGIDLKAFLPEHPAGLDIGPGETKVITTGFKWAIPFGFVGLVCSRSGLAAKNSVFVLNAPGIIDSDYRGDVGVILHNSGKEKFHINTGDRIAQMVIIETSKLAMLRVVDIEVNETTRGAGGFGSTGKGN